MDEKKKSNKNDLYALYLPFGLKWEKTMMQFTKIELIRLLKDSRKDNLKIIQTLKSMKVVCNMEDQDDG